MKFRTGLILGLGVGFVAGRKLISQMTADDPYVVKGPQSEQTGGPVLRLITGRAARITDTATGKSLDAIRRTRGAIQKRLYEPDDDAAWN